MKQQLLAVSMNVAIAAGFLATVLAISALLYGASLLINGPYGN